MRWWRELGTVGPGHHAGGGTDSWATLCESLDVLVLLQSRLNNNGHLLRGVLRDRQTRWAISTKLRISR